MSCHPTSFHSQTLLTERTPSAALACVTKMAAQGGAPLSATKLPQINATAMPERIVRTPHLMLLSYPSTIRSLNCANFPLVQRLGPTFGASFFVKYCKLVAPHDRVKCSRLPSVDKGGNI
jgi:hypothetical protein